MNGNGLGPMNDGNGRCSNPNFTGFGGGMGRGMGMGRGFGRRGFGQGFSQGRGMGMGRGFSQGFPQGRGMGPGRGMGFVNGGPGYGNRVARGIPTEGWTAPANVNKEEE